ncbi:MAG TPA: hypothetical protein DEF12_03720 [Rhodobacteraceae bacterium]|jgi:hypothetical protein|nr:hypothetical protein [Paracoccaceae bacterium]HBV54125.1 hypothetical protein [Paracoccaceae bacterium]
MSRPALDWHVHLNAGEDILWQGRPVPGVSLRPGAWARLGMAVFFLVNAQLWQAANGMVAVALGAGALWLIWETLGRALMTARRRYALTNRRALILVPRAFGGQHLKSYPLGPETVVTLDARSPGHVSFSFEGDSLKPNTTLRAIGFDRIHDARAVYDIIRNLQKGTP